MRKLAMVVLCGAGLLAGCGGSPEHFVDAGGDAQPPEVLLGSLPFHPHKGFACGATSMATLLAGSGTAVEPAALEGRFAGEEGDPRPLMVGIARAYGRLAYPVTGIKALEAELAAGHPVLVVENLGVASRPLWNCAVAVGYRRGGADILIDDDEQARPMRRGVLQRLWSETGEWGLVVVPPGEVPATAREKEMLEAVEGLRHAGRLWEAVVAYDSMLAAWPHDAGALMGLGTTLYMLGDDEGAEQSYRAAAMAAADPAPALAELARLKSEPGAVRPRALHGAENLRGAEN